MPTRGTLSRRDRQARAVANRRVKTPHSAQGERCVAPNCHAPTMAAAGLGFSRSHCKAHFDRFNRHGSYWMGGIPGEISAPLRKAAERWIEREQPVDVELAGITQLMNKAGTSATNAYSLRGLSPNQKALNTLAHLNLLGIKPARVLAAELAVLFVIENATSVDRSADYRRTQVGKALSRLVPATSTTFSNGRVTKKHFQSRGLFLATLGEMIEEASGARLHASTTFSAYVARLTETPGRHTGLSRVVAYLRCPTVNVREVRPDGSVIYRAAKLDITTGKPVLDDPWRGWFASLPGDRAGATHGSGR